MRSSPDTTWFSYAQALREVTPSRILSNEVPDDWWELSIHRVNNKHGIPAQTVLKHPISAEEKPLEKLSEFWSGADDEKRKEFIEVIRKAEEEVFSKLEGVESPGEFARLWNELPQKLKEGYEKALEELDLNPAIAEELVHFPADPSFPDHDWLTRAELYATVKAIKGSGKKPYLLRFKISPVQGFIGNARSERDLWAGSHMLSLMTYMAISEIWHRFGPGSLIIPSLRKQPFFEHEIGSIDDPDELDIANMPNKVLAVVPGDEVEGLRKRIDERIGDFLERLFESAWEFYEMGGVFEKEGQYARTIKNYFSVTIEAVELKTLETVIEEDLRRFLDELPERTEFHHYPELFTILDQMTDFSSANHFPENHPMGFKCTLCGENLAIGGTNSYGAVKERWDTLRKSLRKRGIYDIRENERLCPLCLAKRFYPRFYSIWKHDYTWIDREPAGIVEEARNEHRKRILGLKRFASVSEVALRRPTEKAIELMEEGKLYVEDKGKRPVTWHDVFLYCIFHTGARDEWRGEVRKPVFSGKSAGEFEKRLFTLCSTLMPLFNKLGPNSEVFYPENLSSVKALAKVYGVDENHLKNVTGINPKAIEDALSGVIDVIGEAPRYYALIKMDGDNMGKLISGTKGVKPFREYSTVQVDGKLAGLNRPVTPVLHKAITRSLSHFAVNKVPKIAKDCEAELLYAGGDDVFAIAPMDRALELAFGIQYAFRTDWEGFEYLQGKTRSMSGGILIAHYKEPLYSVIKRLNGLEHLAKESGRNALAIGYLKHSGSYKEVTLNWRVLKGEEALELLKAFREGKVSSKFIYELETETWPNEPGAVLELLKYEFERHSNFKKGEEKGKVNALAGIIWIARNVRVKLSEEDLKELDIPSRHVPDVLKIIGEVVSGIMVDDPELEEPTDSFNDAVAIAEKLLKGEEVEGAWFDEIRQGIMRKTNELLNVLGSRDRVKETATKVSGLVLKRQIEGASRLLKMLLEQGVRG